MLKTAELCLILKAQNTVDLNWFKISVVCTGFEKGFGKAT